MVVAVWSTLSFRIDFMDYFLYQKLVDCYTEHCSVWSYQFYWYHYRQYCQYGEDEDFYGEDEDFYGGRTGPLEKFYLFIYFLLI